MTTDVPSFELAVDADEARVTFTPRGELDLATAPELEDKVLGAIREAGRQVVLDLRELSFMDSSGVRVLVSAHGAGSFVVVRPSRDSEVDRIIEISGIEGALDMVDEP